MGLIYYCVLLRYNLNRSPPLIQNINEYNKKNYRFIFTNQIDKKENRIYYYNEENKLTIDPAFPNDFDATGLTLGVAKYIAKRQPDIQYSHVYIPCKAIFGKDEIIWQYINKGTSELEDKVKSLENTYDNLRAELQKSNDKIEALWYSPHMPGYIQAENDFIHKSLEIRKHRSLSL